MPLVECVPNFSEGRRPEVLEAIAGAAGSVPGVRLLDQSMDPDHNRAVVTLAGEPGPLATAAFAAVREATLRIDLTGHTGVHPRMGSTDVCPFVPLAGATMADCVELAHALGRRVGEELEIPVFYYGEAAREPGRRRLPDVRRGGFEALREAIATDARFRPDAGPARVHPTAGAVAVGARPFLIAFNVDLETDDVGIARSIARSIRESDGGLPGVRALGFLLAEAGVAQVSTNVCDFERTGLVDVFEAVRREASARGVGVRDSELVGMAPRAALDAEVARAVRLRSWDPSRQVIEEALR